MDNNAQDDSDNEFPELPPNNMLNFELGQGEVDGEGQLTVVSDEIYEKERPPEVYFEDERLNSSTDSESEEEERVLDILNSELAKKQKIQSKIFSIERSNKVGTHYIFMVSI